MNLVTNTSGIISDTYYLMNGSRRDRFYALCNTIFRSCNAPSYLDLNSIAWRLCKFPQNTRSKIFSAIVILGTFARAVDDPNTAGELTDYLALLAPLGIGLETLTSQRASEIYEWVLEALSKEQS